MVNHVPIFTHREIRQYLAGMPRKTRRQILRAGATHDYGYMASFVGLIGTLLVSYIVALHLEPILGTGLLSLVMLPLDITLIVGWLFLIRFGAECAIVKRLNRLSPADRHMAREKLASGNVEVNLVATTGTQTDSKPS